MFDPDKFMAAVVDEPMETQLRPAPEGEFRAILGEVNAKSFNEITWTDRETGQPRSAVQLVVPCLIQDEALRAELKRENVTVMWKGFIDFNSDGTLAVGPDKNVRLGQLRAAVGQNTSGPWSFAQLSGAGPLMVKVTHRSDKNDPEKKYPEVSRVSALR